LENFISFEQIAALEKHRVAGKDKLLRNEILRVKKKQVLLRVIVGYRSGK